jgi:N-acetylglucosaminyl-diphospho-decaprenol L-rhamnosyltransferase
VTSAAETAIITVSYNSSAQLADFLTAAVNCVASPSQVFVADNASADVEATRALAAKFGATLVQLDDNFGYGGAINRALKSVPATLTTLIICNPDAVLTPAAVDRLRSEVSDPRVGLAGPRILNEDGSTYPSGRAIPSIGIGIGHALFANIWKSNPWTKKYHAKAYLESATQEVGWVSGSCIAIRRETFESLGGFDEAYFMYFEDVDLAYRLGKRGLVNLYVPEVSITHLGGESTKTVKKHMLKVHHDSAMHFIRVRYPGVLWAPLRAVIRLGLGIRLWLQTRGASA